MEERSQPCSSLFCVTVAMNSAKKKPAIPVLPARRTMRAMSRGANVTNLSLYAISSGSSIFFKYFFFLFLSSASSAKGHGFTKPNHIPEVEVIQ
jgi:hypothetical protein